MDPIAMIFVEGIPSLNLVEIDVDIERKKQKK